MKNESKPEGAIGDRYAIGTRVMVRVEGGYRVRCATCDAGGSRLIRTHSEAFDSAAKFSGHPCRSCGAS